MEKLTRYEKARLIGARALEISMGAPLKIKLNEKELGKINYNAIKLAEIEYEKGVLPLEIVRESVKDTEKPEKKKQ